MTPAQRVRMYLGVMVVVGTVLTVVSCAPVKDPRHDMASDTIRYSQDARTDLCFATFYSRNAYGGVMSLTNVPCTPQVIQQIQADQ